MASCLSKTRTILSVTKALVCRGMFLIHSLICIWRVTVIKANVFYWGLAGTLPLIATETVYTLCRKKSGEWKWVCPSVFLYLATSVPAIWFLELDVMTHRGLVTSHVRRQDEARHDVYNNATDEIMLLNGEIQLDISLGSEEWCKILEQMLLLILIVGRWLLPKGEITREQLSQLLLVYIGMAADIIELFEAFKEDTVRQNRLLNLTILSLWTASLSQFTLVLTATKAKRRRTCGIIAAGGSSGASCRNGVRGCCPTEVMSILLSVLLQDAPFLVLRLLLIFRYDVLSYSNIFFTSKNSLVMMLQIYRLVVLFTDSPTPPPPSSSKTRTNQRHKVTTSKSSRSNSVSFTSDSDGSVSGCSVFDMNSDGSNLTRHRKYSHCGGSLARQARMGSHKGHSGSSIETDLNDSMPGSSSMRRKNMLVTTSAHVNDFTGKSPKRSPGREWNCSCQRSSDVTYSGGSWPRSRTNGDQKVTKGHRERQVHSLDQGSRTPSPLRLPPPPLESPNGSDESDDVTSKDKTKNNNSNGEIGSGKIEPLHQSVGNGQKEMARSSPKCNPGRAKHYDHHNHHHYRHNNHNYNNNHRRHHHHHPDGDDHYHNDVCRSRRHHWSSIKGLQSVLTLLDETGKYRTVVLKRAEDGSPVYVIDKDKQNDHDITV